MQKVEVKSFTHPVEVRTFPKGRVELIEVGGTVVGRATFEPGWKWSESVKPIVHTDLCQAPHLQYHMSGVMIVEQDGVRHVVKAGDVSMLPPGHDAWIEGDEPVHLVDFQGMLDYANSAEQKVQHITEELRSTETRHRLILASVSDGIIGINANGEITFNNPAAASLLGYVESEMLGRKLHQLVHHSYPDGAPFPESECASYQTFQDGQPRTVDSEVFWRKDGSSIPVEYSATSLKQGFAMVGAIVVFRDITERKATLDAILSAKRAAEAANLAKSAFLASISHELRTPLNAILGFADLMRREARAGRAALTAGQAENLATIHRSGEHLLGLINDVLDISKIEAGCTTYQPSDCDLHALLAELRELLRERATRKSLSLRVHWAGAVPRHVRADATKLRQVLINLLGNAVKFTQQGSVLLAVDALGAEQGGRCRLRFAVTDTGPGIAAEEQAKLFQPFSQALVGVNSGEGTGLGLAISRQHVQLMGGDITVQSTPGQGSRFSFELDFEVLEGAAAEAKAQRLVIGLEPGQPRYRVLIADDIDTNRQLLIQNLKPLGFALTEAADGEQALARWRDEQPDLILLDMRMPKMDGYEVARRIRAEEKRGRTPIIAVTASAFEEQRDEVLAAGCDEFLRKPFRDADLFELIGRHLKLAFVYAERAAPALHTAVDAARLGALPAALRAQLREALLVLDGARCGELAEQVAALDPELGAALGKQVKEMRFEELLGLCEAADAWTGT
ncbi:ATP-binding protein [Accumulibacter sp.]|uniref:ATP-binding protein n=1 Tax=Accumulibacter sp. TaxID=2053492 RepID=UPI0028790BCB|nr:ATP-binding protein [Accumulibacter sp.]MDS4054964.1 ATP-binding protein [Accumulibacter sp.]